MAPWRRVLAVGVAGLGLSGTVQAHQTEPPAPAEQTPAAAPDPTPAPATPAVPPESPAPAAPPAGDKPAPGTPAPEGTPPGQTSPVALGPQPAAEATSAPEAATANIPANDVDPWARPNFIKGSLSNFITRPLTRRNFIGVGAGVSALPTDTNTLLNAFYLTIEPQVDFANPRYNWKLGLGAPLQFELVDSRGIFEKCVTQGRVARMAGGDMNSVAIETGTCLGQQKDHLIENVGRLRRADWDQASDFAKIVRYFVIGGQEQPFYLNVSRLFDQTFGHGTVVRDYNANIDYNTTRVGATLDFTRSAVGVQAMANDLVNPDVLGLMAFVRPFRPYTDDIILRSLSAGLSFVHGVNLPRALKYESGLFQSSYDQPIPQVNSDLKPIGGNYRQLDVIGGDLEAKVVRSQTHDVKVYFDYHKMRAYGGGATLGGLWRFSNGAVSSKARRAVRARAEFTYFSADYLPQFFDTYHDIFKDQYLPVAYKATNGIQYYPTKLQYLEASRGGSHRLGAYFEIAHSFLNYFTVGAMARFWGPVGSPGDPNFQLKFPDYSPGCTSTNGFLTCPSQVVLKKEPGFSSVRLSLEVPLRRFLQAFASYEVFSTTAENGLGLFSFHGDNEIFFSGARLMVLPFFFIQAEARRYFFMQRVHDVDLQNLTLQQDQNYHASWTLAVNAFIGYEF